MQDGGVNVYFYEDATSFTYPFLPSWESVRLSSVGKSLEETELPSLMQNSRKEAYWWGPILVPHHHFDHLGAPEYKTIAKENIAYEQRPHFLFVPYGIIDPGHILLDTALPLFSVVLDTLGAVADDVQLVYVGNWGHSTETFHHSWAKFSAVLSMLSTRPMLEVSELAELTADGRRLCFGNFIAGLRDRNHMQLRSNFTTFGSGYWSYYNAHVRRLALRTDVVVDVAAYRNITRGRPGDRRRSERDGNALSIFVKQPNERRGLDNIDELLDTLSAALQRGSLGDLKLVSIDPKQHSFVHQVALLVRTSILISYTGALSFGCFMFLKPGSAHILISEYLGNQGPWFQRAEVYLYRP